MHSNFRHIKLISLALCCFGIGCTPIKKPQEYELNLETCYQMQADPAHAYWQQPIAVQGCDMLIADYEMQAYEHDQ